ncbi:MAG: glycoside hydrolase family 25 protein [Oscillospiraceae bacterium]|nr:glycoside hydrolase family 25 protein [Oscillospiraceae bacterium]
METERIGTELPKAEIQEAKKPFWKTPLFWGLTVGGGLVLTAAVLIAVILCLPGGRHHTTPDLPSQPETTAPTTEPTLPPPEANPIGLGDFAMEDGYLYCITAPSVRGIDVSEWQGEIDWQQVKDSGVEFAMIRVGWRGSEQGVLAEDTYARANYAGATAAGIKVGAYFFSQAISPEEAIEEANYLLEIIRDWKLDMPVVYDWEFISEDSRTGKTDPRTLTDCTKAFCDTVAKAGYDTMVYFNTDHSYNNIYIRELTDYPFWLARYDTVLDYPYKVDMWQYTETGSVPGISTNVDINLYFPWEK